jgi:hypothetical protein
MQTMQTELASEHIREYLKGWSEEFIGLCCERFRRGEMVSFDVTFPDA